MYIAILNLMTPKINPPPPVQKTIAANLLADANKVQEQGDIIPRQFLQDFQKAQNLHE